MCVCANACACCPVDGRMSVTNFYFAIFLSLSLFFNCIEFVLVGVAYCLLLPPIRWCVSNFSIDDFHEQSAYCHCQSYTHRLRRFYRFINIHLRYFCWFNSIPFNRMMMVAQKTFSEKSPCSNIDARKRTTTLRYPLYHSLMQFWYFLSASDRAVVQMKRITWNAQKCLQIHYDDCQWRKSETWRWCDGGGGDGGEVTRNWLCVFDWWTRQMRQHNWFISSSSIFYLEMETNEIIIIIIILLSIWILVVISLLLLR